MVGQTRVAVVSWTLRVVVLLLLRTHLVVVDLGDLIVSTGQARTSNCWVVALLCRETEYMAIQ